MSNVYTFADHTPISGRQVKVIWYNENAVPQERIGTFNEVNGYFTVDGRTFPEERAAWRYWPTAFDALGALGRGVGEAF